MVIESCNVPTIRKMLEFIYTNRIEGLNSCSASEIIDLLSVADEYLLAVSTSYISERQGGASSCTSFCHDVLTMAGPEDAM